MYIDILPNDNLDQPVMATFKETAPGREICAIRLHLDDGAQWCAVVGWTGNGPVEALYTAIEESGDGPGRLVSGGEHGLRLARISGPTKVDLVRWNLLDDTQWAEPFLLCLPETEVAWA